MKKRLMNYHLPLLWCLFTIITLIIWFFADLYIADFNLMYLLGFNTALYSLEMFIGGTLFGDGILAYLSIPYLILLIAFLVCMILAMLLLMIKKSNKLFRALLISDCIISVLTIAVLCVYNIEDAFVWDKVCGVLLNLLFLVLMGKKSFCI